jgi:glycosyltransferase involved in cell wall biosynthesis
VICSHNGGRTLPSALAHIRRQSLSSERFEVIVVDDGSTDGTSEIAEAHGARVIRLEPSSGIAAARNAGVSAAKGAIIAFTDDDCEPRKDWLAALTSSLTDHCADGVGGQIIPASTDGLVLRYLAVRRSLNPLGTDRLLASTNLGYRIRLYLRNFGRLTPQLSSGAGLAYVATANAAFRRELLVELGGFDEGLAFAGEDVDLCRRAHSRTGGSLLLYEPSAVVLHRFKPELRDTLRRSRAYGKGATQRAIKHREIRLTVYPFPILVFTGIMAAILARRKRPALLSAIVPLATYIRWPIHAWRTRSLEPLAYPYLQLAEETWTTLGELEGRRTGYAPAPSTHLRAEQATPDAAGRPLA